MSISFNPQFMEVAFTYAREALVAGEVPIGCVFVFNSEIIGGGRNIVNDTKNATRHAELGELWFRLIDKFLNFINVPQSVIDSMFFYSRSWPSDKVVPG